MSLSDEPCGTPAFACWLPGPAVLVLVLVRVLGLVLAQAEALE